MMENTDKQEAFQACIMHGCERYRAKSLCAKCGFNIEEHERRVALPFSIDANGRRYKYVGPPREEAE